MILFFLFSLFSHGEDAKYLKFLKADVRKDNCHFHFEVENGFHIQANPASAPNLIPTTINFEENAALEFSTPKYPSPKSYSLKGFGSLAAYSGKFKIEVPCKVKSKYTAAGKIRYQACNEKTCFFPMTLPFTF